MVCSRPSVTGGRIPRASASIVASADPLELPAPTEFLREGDEVDRLAPFEERDHRVEDGLVGRLVERLRRKHLDRFRDGFLLEEHRPENGRLDLDRLRRDAAFRPCRRDVRLVHSMSVWHLSLSLRVPPRRSGSEHRRNEPSDEVRHRRLPEPDEGHLRPAPEP